MKKWNMASLAPLLFLLLTINCSLLTVTAQTQFQRAIGGTDYDYGHSIVQTTDGGYAVAGYTYSFGVGSPNFYIVKLNAGGTLQWSRTVGGTGADNAWSIIQTSDGGYAVAGYTNSFGAGLVDMYIVKLGAGGTLQWSRTVGGAGDEGGFNTFISIIQTIDGGYAVAGFTYSFGAGNADFYIVKLNSSGMLQWSKTVGGTNYDYGYSIIQTTDGGYAVAGETISFGALGYDMYIVKLDGSGTLQWSRTIGGIYYDRAYSIIQTTDGGYAVAGVFESATDDDMYIVKLDGSGMLQWSKTVGGTSIDEAFSIIQTTDGGYAVAGFTFSFFSFGGGAFYIVKLNASGTLQWSRTTLADFAYSIKQTTDGGYVVAGETRYSGADSTDNIYIVKLDASGNTCGNTTSPLSTLGSPTSTVTSPTPTVTTPTTTVTSPSSQTSSGGTLNSICTFVGIEPISNEIPTFFELFQNYPNPFNSNSKIKMQISKLGDVRLVIYDILGNEISELVNEELRPGIYESDWDASNYPSGVYYYRLTVSNFSETKKMVLLK